MKKLYDTIRLNFAIYPGIIAYRCADFAVPYYEALKQRQGPLRIVFNALVFAGFALFAGIRVSKVARKWGWDKTRIKQARRFARRHFVLPDDIAHYDITDEAQFAVLMRRFEHVGIARAISDPKFDHDPLLTNKSVFAALAREHDIPHPVTLARICDGAIEVLADPPGREMIAKPNRGSGGKGVVALELAEDVALTRDDLAAWLQKNSSFKQGDWIVQQRVVPHPELAVLALDALPTIRVTVILDEGGAPEIVTSVLRLPAKRNVVADNVKQGGLIVGVDPATGSLGQARNGTGPGSFDAHPETGAPIAGVTLSQWPEVAKLVRDIHARHFAQHVQVGWDIALTERGPMVIEPNARPGPRMAQRALMKGLGATRHGELLEFHLKWAAQRRGSRRFLTQG